MKIVKNETERERRKRFDRLVDITRETIVGCSVFEAFDYFSVRTSANERRNSLIYVHTDKNILFVYSEKFIKDAVRLAKAYENAENIEFNVHACFNQ